MVGNQATPLLAARTSQAGGVRCPQMSEPDFSTPDSSTPQQPMLEKLRLRRAELRESISTLRQALVAPAADGHARWVQRVHVALVELSADLREHVTVTDSPCGLHRDLLRIAPRLTAAAARLTREHLIIIRQVEELLARAGAPNSDQDVDTVHRHGTTLLKTLIRHRQRGFELVYQAYAVDIGDGD